MDDSQQELCDHGIEFDEAWCKRENPSSQEVRERYPRLSGPCPKGCGFHGIGYANLAHFIWGDW